MKRKQERRAAICEMREEGHTFKEIGDRYHISRQRAHAIYISKRGKTKYAKCIFQSVSKYMQENQLSVKDLSKLAGIPYATLVNKLSGKTKLYITEAAALCKLSGSTMEELLRAGE